MGAHSCKAGIRSGRCQALIVQTSLIVLLKHLKQKSIAVSGVDNLQIFNNTIYGTNPNISGYRPMVSISGNNSGLVFSNNIVHGTASADDFVSRCFYIGDGDTIVASLDHNLYFQDHPRQIIHYSSSTSYRMADWSQYQINTGWDLHSPAPQNPIFVNAVESNFRLQWQANTKSPAIDAGTAMPGRQTDFYGNPVVGPPDIGAVEYQP